VTLFLTPSGFIIIRLFSIFLFSVILTTSLY
jgi:hypothetical protein